MRSLSALFKAASKADNFIFGVAAELDFPTGFVRINTSPYAITISGNVFSGVGSLGKVSTITEDASLTARGISLTLSGIDPATLGAALNEDPRGRPCRLWVCLFDHNHALINSPYPVGAWKMDTMSVAMGERATVTLSAESALADWDRPRIRYYTDADQQSRYQGDTFFDLLTPNLDKEIIWGRV